MNLEEIEPEIQKIVEIVEKLPERYRDKCFEIMIQKLISENNRKEKTVKNESENENSSKEFDFQVPIELRAFFRQFSLDEGKIYEQFIVTGKDEIAPTYKIKTTVISKAQIQIALMTALENTLLNRGSFEFSIEDIRKKCEE